MICYCIICLILVFLESCQIFAKKGYKMIYTFSSANLHDIGIHTSLWFVCVLTHLLVVRDC